MPGLTGDMETSSALTAEDTRYPVTGIILAGGKSKRMGKPKADLDIGGRPLIDRVIDRVRLVCEHVVIVTRRPLDFLDHDLTVVKDLVPGQGPLGGLATGLAFSRHHWSLVAACDLPFLKVGVLRYLIEQALEEPEGPRAVVPKTQGGWQPLVAVYSSPCIKPALRLLAAGGRKVDDLRFQGVGWHSVEAARFLPFDPGLESFINVNTPDQLVEARIRVDTDL